MANLASALKHQASTRAHSRRRRKKKTQQGGSSGEAAEAETLLRRALRVREQALGEKRGSRHPDLASLQLQLAELLEEQGVR
jgi:hypothetical protein